MKDFVNRKLIKRLLFLMIINLLFFMIIIVLGVFSVGLRHYYLVMQVYDLIRSLLKSKQLHHKVCVSYLMDNQVF